MISHNYVSFALFEGGTNFFKKKQDSATIKWKYVDQKALSTLGLTSGVRKVMLLLVIMHCRPVSSKREDDRL